MEGMPDNDYEGFSSWLALVGEVGQKRLVLR